MRKIKDILTIIIFCIVIFGFCVAFALIPDKDVSRSERRKLAQLPEFSAKMVFSGDFSEELETYFLDQFPMREWFRGVNASVRINALRQNDVNGLWVAEGSIFKNEDALKENQVEYGAMVINNIYNKYLQDMNVYYSVIPDKNYFYNGGGLHPEFDYARMLKILDDNISDCKYIDIFNTLELDDYYKTDSHWSQDKIFPTAQKLAGAMGMAEVLTPESEYKVNKTGPFYGVYWGQAALDAEPDTIYYLSSKDTEGAKVSGISPEISKEVYALEKLEGMDGYDIFLSGAQPVITIECDGARTDRELIIFRDSYGSSIAPFFCGAYSKITLVDLRYITSELVGEYVEFNPNQDALFLYSTMLLNSSMLLK